jgi:C1A family cysteine protease
MKHKLGCHKDKKDKRDLLMKHYLKDVAIPSRIDYTDKMSPVRNQKNEGTCVAFASAVGMKEYQELIDYSQLVKLSPRFLYQECKKIDGMPYEEGTSIAVAFNVLRNKGVCLEDIWPYVAEVPGKPKDGAAVNANKYRVLSYARINNINELRASIALKGPAVIGIECFEGIMRSPDGYVPLPQSGEKSQGGHAVCAVGYDDIKKLIKFKNSWGQEWGDCGYGYLPYEYIGNYSIDMWSAIDIQDDEVVIPVKRLTFWEWIKWAFSRLIEAPYFLI